MGMMTNFEAVLAALFARDNVYPSDLEQKNMVKAEFLRGAATAFALCWRGEESSQCLEAAKGLDDQLTSPDRGAMPAGSPAFAAVRNKGRGLSESFSFSKLPARGPFHSNARTLAILSLGQMRRTRNACGGGGLKPDQAWRGGLAGLVTRSCCGFAVGFGPAA
jgi:hypothetical protein